MSGVKIARLDYPRIPISIKVTNDYESGYRVHACQKEPWTMQFIETMEAGDVLLDLGANVGSYTLIAAALGHLVIAVEPSFSSYARLVENCLLNQLLDRVAALPVAIGSETGLTWFQFKDLQPGAASHIIGQPPGDKPIFFHRQRVMLYRFDDLAALINLPAPTHIKMDLDGGELNAINGMPTTLGNAKLKGLMLEMKAEQETVLVARLAELGLKMVGRFDERGGQKIGDIAYGLFTR